MKRLGNNEFMMYKVEAEDKWGNTEAYKEYTKRTKNYTQEKWGNIAEGMDYIMAEFALCMRSNEESGSAKVQNLVQMLQTHITENYYTCTNEILVDLGIMYVEDERFKSNIDKYGEGTAMYVYKAITLYCCK